MPCSPLYDWLLKLQECSLFVFILLQLCPRLSTVRYQNSTRSSLWLTARNCGLDIPRCMWLVVPFSNSVLNLLDLKGKNEVPIHPPIDQRGLDPPSNYLASGFQKRSNSLESINGFRKAVRPRLAIYYSPVVPITDEQGCLVNPRASSSDYPEGLRHGSSFFAIQLQAQPEERPDRR